MVMIFFSTKERILTCMLNMSECRVMGGIPGADRQVSGDGGTVGLECLVMRSSVSAGSTLGKSQPGLWGCGGLILCLENQHFGTLGFFHYNYNGS